MFRESLQPAASVTHPTNPNLPAKVPSPMVPLLSSPPRSGRERASLDSSADRKSRPCAFIEDLTKWAPTAPHPLGLLRPISLNAAGSVRDRRPPCEPRLTPTERVR